MTDEVVIRLTTIGEEVRIPMDRADAVRAELMQLFEDWLKHVRGKGPKDGAQVVRHQGRIYLASRMEVRDLMVELYEFKRRVEGKEPFEGYAPPEYKTS